MGKDTWAWFHRLASPPYVYRLASRLAPWFTAVAVLALAAGLYGGLWLAPPDYRQGDGFRIIYIHVPSAYLSLSAYLLVAVASAAGLVWRLKLAYIVAAAAAPIGASFTLLALVTGSLWGKPMWGAYWVWDARLTSELILLFLYVGYMALARGYADPRSGERAAAVLALVGAVNVPIIHYSVVWWSTLHQGPTLFASGGPKIAMSMLAPLLCMLLGFTCFFGACLLRRIQAGLLEREHDAGWVNEVIGS